MDDIYAKFKVAIIEHLHGKPYADAIKYDRNPITLDRVIKAVHRSPYVIELHFPLMARNCVRINAEGEKQNLWWELVKSDGYTPCTHEDQSKETLYGLMKVLI